MNDNILEKITEARAKAPQTVSLKKLEAQAARRKAPLDFSACFRGEGIHVIAELKKASPSKGLIREDFPVVSLAKELESAGAAALSILTEPDCHPQSTQWLRTMTNAFTARTQIVLGYTNYTPERTGIRSRLFFRLYHQIQYLTWATHHKAYRGSLTNLGYRKSYFMSHKGFAEDVNLICGAGELLVNRHSTSDNTAVVLQPEAKMLQDPVLSPKDWTEKNVRYMETRRHFIKTGAYRFIFNLKQWIPVVFFLFWLATLGMACINRQYHIVAGISTLIYLLTNIWQTIQFNSSCRTLEEKPYGINLSIYLITLPFRHVSSLMRYMQRPRRSFQRHAI